MILESTKRAMGDLDKKLQFHRDRGQIFGPLWAVRINSGLFKVPWAQTKKVLEQCHLPLTALRPAGEDEDEVTDMPVVPKEISALAQAKPAIEKLVAPVIGQGKTQVARKTSPAKAAGKVSPTKTGPKAVPTKEVEAAPAEVGRLSRAKTAPKTVPTKKVEAAPAEVARRNRAKTGEARLTKTAPVEKPAEVTKPKPAKAVASKTKKGVEPSKSAGNRAAQPDTLTRKRKVAEVDGNEDHEALRRSKRDKRT